MAVAQRLPILLAVPTIAAVGATVGGFGAIVCVLVFIWLGFPFSVGMAVARRRVVGTDLRGDYYALAVAAAVSAALTVIIVGAGILGWR